MDDKTKKELGELFTHINDKDIERETNLINIAESDPLFSLKNVLFRFFQKRLDVIQEEEKFKSEIKNAIREKINNDELSSAQLISLYQKVCEQGVYSTNAILDVFKPSKEGAISPLVQPHPKEDINSAGTTEELPPAQSEALIKLAELVEKLNKEKESTK